MNGITEEQLYKAECKWDNADYAYKNYKRRNKMSEDMKKALINAIVNIYHPNFIAGSAEERSAEAINFLNEFLEKYKPEELKEPETPAKLKINLWVEENPNGTALLFFQDLVKLRGTTKKRDLQIAFEAFDNVVDAEEFKEKVLESIKFAVESTCNNDEKELVPFQEYEFYDDDISNLHTYEFLVYNEGNKFPYVVRDKDKETYEYENVKLDKLSWSTTDNKTYSI